MSTFNLEIVTPTQILESVNVSYARCPGVDGLFGIMSGHREAIIALDLCEIKSQAIIRMHIIQRVEDLSKSLKIKLIFLLKQLKSRLI